MRRILLIMVLLMTAIAVRAEWTRVGENDDSIQYVNRATIRRNGNLVKMWNLVDFKTVKKSALGVSYLSQKTQKEYNCKEEKHLFLAFSWFDGKMGDGNVVLRNGNVRDEWEPIQPESAGEVLWKIACGK
jgi:hypothetical protein